MIKYSLYDYLLFSHLFQRHNVHGGRQRSDHHPRAQLSPPPGGHSRDARLGILDFLHKYCSIAACVQVQKIFLQWIPWMLRMSRPGEKITRKSILMQKKIKEIDKTEVSSKSLLANVLDMDDNFCATTIAPSINGNHPSHTKPPILNGCFTR